MKAIASALQHHKQSTELPRLIEAAKLTPEPIQLVPAKPYHLTRITVIGMAGCWRRGVC